jgi:hypothetical protein
MVEQVDAFVADLEENYVAILFRGLDHERKPAARELEQHVTWESCARPGWGPGICGLGARIWIYGGHRE